jgi:hypothetical protein
MFRPGKGFPDEGEMGLDMEMDSEMALALMESMGENPLEKMLDGDFFRSFDDDFIEDDLS